MLSCIDLSSPLSVRDVTDVPHQRGGRVMIRLSFDHETTSSSRPLAIHSAACDIYLGESAASILPARVPGTFYFLPLLLAREKERVRKKRPKCASRAVP